MSSSIVAPKRKAEQFGAETLIMHKFLVGMNYTPLQINPLNEELEAHMIKVMDSRNIRCQQLERSIHLASSLVMLCYPELSMEEKKVAALFNWFMLYADDRVPIDVTPFRHFKERFSRNLPQLDPVMDVLADVLRQVWELWDPLGANFIVSGALNFMTGSCIEASLKSLPPVSGDSRFASFLREATGASKSYGAFGFSKSNHFSAMDYAQVISDMEYWINLTNDLLSFYKEELNGDTNTYVYTRAEHESKSVLEVLADIAEEMIVSRDIIHGSLAHNPRVLQAWKAAEQGYIHWHLILEDRYKLGDLGLLSSFSELKT